MVTLYKNGVFKIFGYANTNEVIIHNTKKSFDDGHTHIRNYDTAIWLIKLAKHKSIPKRKNKYFIESLIRISTDNTYINQLKKYL